MTIKRIKFLTRRDSSNFSTKSKIIFINSNKDKRQGILKILHLIGFQSGKMKQVQSSLKVLKEYRSTRRDPFK